MSRPIRCIAPLVAIAMTTTVLAVPAASDGASTRTCKLSGPQAEHLGPTYVVDAKGHPGFNVRVTSCANGKKVIQAFHSCRLKKGKAGRCTTRVLGYSCSEKRSAQLVVAGRLQSFDGDVICKKSTARVTHHYTQNT
jgi:hypothetical protein